MMYSLALRRSSGIKQIGFPASQHYAAAAARHFSWTPSDRKLVAPPMCYISGEEMTNYTMKLIMDQWIKPHIDTSTWEFYDLSCKSRDDTEDKVLHDAVAAGKRLKAIFKEPTITPTAVQVKEMGLKKGWGSPNGAMRRGWNGITISRDTIHIDGMELGFKRPVLFERHAVGGEYGAGYGTVGKGQVVTTFTEDGGSTIIIDARKLTDEKSAIVVYDNPLDNVADLAHHFFTRCLEAEVTPYVVTKKTVFKWQEGFWLIMKDVFEKHYAEKYAKTNLLAQCGGELQHLISDAATMQIIRWTGGGFGMACHNYDGDMLTDEVAQVHRSPGFITSNLIGKAEDGTMIKEFEASHGTVADMWHAHLEGKETSLNPLGMVEALIGAMNHAAALNPQSEDSPKIVAFTTTLRSHIHKAMVAGYGTRDLCGPEGLTTEAFTAHVAGLMDGTASNDPPRVPVKDKIKNPTDEDLAKEGFDVDMTRGLFAELDVDGNGSIDFVEFIRGLDKLNVLPSKGLLDPKLPSMKAKEPDVVINRVVSDRKRERKQGIKVV
eukprot:gnl/MRDRNA2_/MRDRNA2_125078_c0_seq1.p1 gnl/MRDRNA2_/MRDRNA2_125078_c0~~gnl/MRDRNA2_/MRDRNA2_125078_c0_seq1.p1  ORF type:complete len:547 (-),score=112.16 gnl/MRDRNA2_/MRDRNA2_125078_c0_seq1:7-1647(-)